LQQIKLVTELEMEMMLWRCVCIVSDERLLGCRYRRTKDEKQYES